MNFKTKATLALKLSATALLFGAFYVRAKLDHYRASAREAQPLNLKDMPCSEVIN